MIRLTCCRLILGTPDNATRPYLKFSLNTKEALSKYKESMANQLQSGYMKVIFEYYVQCSRQFEYLYKYSMPYNICTNLFPLGNDNKS